MGANVCFSPNVGFRTADSNIALRPCLFSKCSRFSTQIQSHPLKLGRLTTRAQASNSVEQSESYTSSTQAESRDSVNPVYVPTPANRELRTPHSGFHFDGSTRTFFEGWYFKVSIPESKQSFCFMYSMQNPAFKNKLSRLEVVQHGHRFTGVGAQILGADDKSICQYSEESPNFWGSRHELMLGNTFIAEKDSRPPKKEVPPQEFNRSVAEGFQASPLWHQGFIRDDGRSNYGKTVKTARWEYSTRPVYGWGNVGSKQKSTAGWLAVFPMLKKKQRTKQILWNRGATMEGIARSWIEWDGERFEFQDAPSYSEKNWGAGFPRKWFWKGNRHLCSLEFLAVQLINLIYSQLYQLLYYLIVVLSVSSIVDAMLQVQCNVFKGASGEVALTAGGGLRQLPGLSDTYENAALVLSCDNIFSYVALLYREAIGVHYDGIFYEFVPWNGVVNWEIAPWGYWYIAAENERHLVELTATTKDPGSTLRAPTVESGFAEACKDTCFGDLRLQMWERRYDGTKGKLILDVTSDMAAVEVGGGPWFNTWKGKTNTPELLRRALGIPVDVDGFFGLVPLFKPPGL
ncbi:hypothetical protein JRO89_XS03G0270500 [Xanthoceras sorbifolium]|uniref:Tocopherol cyclase n=1 Tax=Xanthoceras sorbifolium TaxID=99658 RepID=A0ABQ8IC59_9ROSI|nr:hypothetical protein JRO89_XS03G0270500 [Xanthoceras sorbifolium]